MAVILSNGQEKIRREYEIALQDVNGVTEEQTKAMFEMFEPVIKKIEDWCEHPLFNAKVMSSELSVGTLIRYLYTKILSKFGENNLKAMAQMSGGSNCGLAIVEDDVVYQWIFDFFDFDGKEMLKKEAEEQAKREKEAEEQKEKYKKLRKERESKKASEKKSTEQSPKTSEESTTKEISSEEKNIKEVIAEEKPIPQIESRQMDLLDYLQKDM